MVTRRQLGRDSEKVGLERRIVTILAAMVSHGSLSTMMLVIDHVSRRDVSGESCRMALSSCSKNTDHAELDHLMFCLIFLFYFYIICRQSSCLSGCTPRVLL